MRFVSFESATGTLALGSKVKLTSSLTGTGLPPVAVQWFEGAGDGANYRGARVLPRTLDLPLSFYGTDREDTWDLFSQLAVIFAPTNGNSVRMKMELDGDVWYSDIVRTGGGDFSWDKDTNGSTFLRTVITVQAGDPYWTRNDATSQVVSPGGLGRGLIKTPSPRLSALKVSTTNSLGSVTFQNPGDVAVYPVWTLSGPFTGFTLTSPSGDVLSWTGTVLVNESIKVDTEAGTVVNQLGVNKYAGLGAVPRFWSIPAGNSVGTVEMLNTSTSGSVATVLWRPKKWMLF
jgi:hypothetical protein